MRNILIVARKEIQEGMRNRWVLATTLLLAGLALSLTFLGSAPTGTVGVRALDVVIVSLSSLTIFLLPLIALLISHDARLGTSSMAASRSLATASSVWSSSNPTSSTVDPISTVPSGHGTR